MAEEEKKSKIKRYYLDGYVYGEKTVMKKNGKEYEIQMFQGDHEDEYLISEMKDGKVEGRCNLFESGLLCLSWTVKDGVRIGGITEYDKGKAVSIEGWSGLQMKGDRRVIENSKEELSLVIYDVETTCVVYRGEYDEEMNRHGKGKGYRNGKLRYDAYWNKDKLKRIVREYKDDVMIEYEDCENANVLCRIPIYVGGYTVVDGEVIRNGVGYVIDGTNGTAMRESEWSNGQEVNQVNLHNGWYIEGVNDSMRFVLSQDSCSEEIKGNKDGEGIRIEVRKSAKLRQLTTSVEYLVIASKLCNDIISLNLNQYKYLKSLEIGSECFSSVESFDVSSLMQLKSIKIGMNSFTKCKNTCGSSTARSFRILNCAALESIDIDRFSFSDYAGEFKLQNLPSLISIRIGRVLKVGGQKEKELWSDNFYDATFLIGDLPSLASIELGNYTFAHSLVTVIANMPKLKSIYLGQRALIGRYYDPMSSLTLQNLPELTHLQNPDGGSFRDVNTVTLINIPKLSTVVLPSSFSRVIMKSVSKDVSQNLAKLIPAILQGSIEPVRMQ